MNASNERSNVSGAALSARDLSFAYQQCGQRAMRPTHNLSDALSRCSEKNNK
jgi:hypothetical protein